MPFETETAIVREWSNKTTFVVPAQAGTQENQMRLDARLRGHDN
jgi:hypothetical protein